MYLDRGLYTRIPGSKIGVWNDLLKDVSARKQCVSFHLASVNPGAKPSIMMDMDTGSKIPRKKLEDALIKIIEVNGGRYLYQKNENGMDVVCRISDTGMDKAPFLESVFVGGDNDEFVDEMLSKAGQLINSGNPRDVNIGKSIEGCYSDKAWSKLRLSRDQCYRSLSYFESLSDNGFNVAVCFPDCIQTSCWLGAEKNMNSINDVAIEQTYQKVKISIEYFNELLTAVRTVEDCLKYKAVKGFMTTNYGDIDCKVIIPVFESASGYTINLRMYPNGYGVHRGKSLSVVFDMVGNNEAKGKLLPTPDVKMEVTLVNHVDTKNSVLANMESINNKGLREPAMLDLELLQDSDSDFLTDDTLVMHCQFLCSTPLTIVPVKKS